MKIICPAATIIARQLSQTKPLGFTYSFIIECSRGATLLVSNQKGCIHPMNTREVDIFAVILNNSLNPHDCKAKLDTIMKVKLEDLVENQPNWKF